MTRSNINLRKYVQPFVIGATLIPLFFSACGLILTAPPVYRGFGDFRQLYAAGYMVRTGQAAQLHDFAASDAVQDEVVGPAEGALPFNHLAVESLLYAPLTFLNYRAAYIAFLALNVALLVFACKLLRPYLTPLAEIWKFLPAAIFAAFLPVTLALAQGQDSILLLALFIAALRAIDRGADLTAGILVGLTLFKFQYGLPVALLYLIWRRWRLLLGFTASAAALVGTSLALTGIHGFVAYLHSLTEMSSHFSSTYGLRYGIHPNLMPNLRGLVQALALGPTPTAFHVTAVLSLLVLIWAATRRPSLPLALLAAILVSYHHLITDTTMMIFPAALALTASPSSATNSRRAAVVALAALIFLAPALLLLAGVRFYLLAIPMLALFIVWDGVYSLPLATQPIIEAPSHN
jgi:hypothetical protein